MNSFCVQQNIYIYNSLSKQNVDVYTQYTQQCQIDFTLFYTTRHDRLREVIDGMWVNGVNVQVEQFVHSDEKEEVIYAKKKFPEEINILLYGIILATTTAFVEYENIIFFCSLNYLRHIF